MENELHVQEFYNWVNERHAIYLRRSRGDPWPWTDDPILQTYKFTNVFRELDRGTVWLREHFIQPYWEHQELFANIAMYRRYNWIGTAEELGFMVDYDPEWIVAQMEARKARGEQIFTGAHMLCGGIRYPDGTLPFSKVEQIFGIAFKILWDNREELEPMPGEGLEDAYNRLLSKVPGFGPFITYEIVTDLRHTRYLCDAHDIMTWANPGPGAKRGICRVLGKDIKEPISRDYQITCMKWLLDISDDFKADWVPQMEMRDIEHSLCEFDKYERTRTGLGKPRCKFTPPHLRSPQV